MRGEMARPEIESSKVAPFQRKDRSSDTEIADAVVGLQFQVEQVDELAQLLDPENLPGGAAALGAIHGLQSILAEASVVLARVVHGFKGPLGAPAISVVAIQLRAVPIDLTVLGMRAEALPADLGAAVDSFAETFADHCDDEDRAVLARAAQILKTEPASPGTDESEA